MKFKSVKNKLSNGCKLCNKVYSISKYFIKNNLFKIFYVVLLELPGRVETMFQAVLTFVIPNASASQL